MIKAPEQTNDVLEHNTCVKQSRRRLCTHQLTHRLLTASCLLLAVEETQLNPRNFTVVVKEVKLMQIDLCGPLDFLGFNLLHHSRLW